jgi:transcriptional regulator with XRE-family HTH domain
MAGKAKTRQQKTGLYYAREARGMSRTELVKRSGVSKQQLSRLENGLIRLGILFAANFGFGKGSPVPGRVHNRPEIDGVLDRQFVGIADADDPFGRVATKEERRQGDREDDGFEMPRRYGYDQPFGLAAHDAFGPIDHAKRRLRFCSPADCSSLRGSRFWL